MPLQNSVKEGRNGQPVQEAELELNIDDLRAELGLDAIEERMDQLEALFTEWLTYLNMVDERLQRLDAQPVVTTKTKMNIGSDGRVELERLKPELPANVMAQAPRSRNEPDKH